MVWNHDDIIFQIMVVLLVSIDFSIPYLSVFSCDFGWWMNFITVTVELMLHFLHG